MTELTDVWIDEAASIPPEAEKELAKIGVKRLPRNVRRQRDKKFRENWHADRLSRRPYADERKTLAIVNDALVSTGRTLHPTKGFRKISVKRALAGIIVSEVRRGLMKFEVTELKQVLSNAEKR